jgi:hypothetical protein
MAPSAAARHRYPILASDQVNVHDTRTHPSKTAGEMMRYAFCSREGANTLVSSVSLADTRHSRVLACVARYIVSCFRPATQGGVVFS